MSAFEFSDQLGQGGDAGGGNPPPPVPVAPSLDFATDLSNSLTGEVGALPERAAPSSFSLADEDAPVARGNGNGNGNGNGEAHAVPVAAPAIELGGDEVTSPRIEPTIALSINAGLAAPEPPPAAEPSLRQPALAQAAPPPPAAPAEAAGGSRMPALLAMRGGAEAAPPSVKSGDGAKPGNGDARPGIFAAVGAPAQAPAAPRPAAGSNGGRRPAIFSMLNGGEPEPEPALPVPVMEAALPAVIEPPADQSPVPLQMEAPVLPPPAPPGGGSLPPPDGGGGAGGGGGQPPSGGGGGGSGGGGPPAGGDGGAPGGGGGGPPAGGGGGPPGGARIGDKLVEMGLISKDQLEVALYERKRTQKLLGTLLVELGFITEAALSAVLASASGFERFDVAGTVADTELLKRIPKEVAQRYRVFPVSIEGNSLRLAMADIYDVVALDQMHRYVPPGMEIIPLVSNEADILQAIDNYYGYEFSIDGILRELETGKHDTSTAALSGDTYVHPLVRLVNAVLLDAVKQGASDIHFEPEGTFLRLRYRIDGVMQQVRTFHKDHWPAISHRLKIVSGMNIADKLNPQDGRFGLQYGTRRIDFRVAALPTTHGENIVIRILDKSRAMMSLDDLGFSESNLKLLARLLLRPEGIIIVTGPTGSGKTTTLYGVLNHVSTIERNIMTLEDPIEYELPLIRQAQVREGTGLNFSDGVRALLRQDPDIIFIGEVRDNATASMALRAAMTGHQVYTTLHTNDAAGALPRLHDLGLDHSLLAGNIIGILAQRLVRKVCTVCSKKRPATEEECRIFRVDPKNPPMIAQQVGCDECRRTGYRGRIAVHELLPVNKDLDEIIIAGASLVQVRSEALKHGYVPLADDAILKILKGVTTLEAVMRSVDITERL